MNVKIKSLNKIGKIVGTYKNGNMKKIELKDGTIVDAVYFDVEEMVYYYLNEKSMEVCETNHSIVNSFETKEMAEIYKIGFIAGKNA